MPKKKYVIYISSPHVWHLTIPDMFQECLFKPSHKNAGISWGYLCAHRCANFLDVQFFIEFKLVAHLMSDLMDLLPSLAKEQMSISSPPCHIFGSQYHGRLRREKETFDEARQPRSVSSQFGKQPAENIWHLRLTRISIKSCRNTLIFGIKNIGCRIFLI